MSSDLTSYKWHQLLPLLRETEIFVVYLEAIYHSLPIGSGGGRPQNLGGNLRGKLIFWGGKIEFLKR